MVAESVMCGPDPRPHLDAIEKAGHAGYTHVCIHQIGPEQEAFIEFYEREVLPELGEGTSRRRKPAVKATKPAARASERARAGRR